MFTKQNLGRALLILFVAGILVGAGYALYRIGYAQGIQDNVQLGLGGRFDHGFPRGVERGFRPWGRVGFSPLRAIPWLLFTLAALMLVVVATISLIRMIPPRRGDSSGPPAADEPPASTAQDNVLSTD